MPRYVLVLAALASACASPASPGAQLAGTWAEQLSIPGASLVVYLDASGNGSGTYAIEAGRSGALQVTGTATPSTVTLVLRYDYGLVQTFSGAFADANRIVGSFTGNGGPVTFERR